MQVWKKLKKTAIALLAAALLLGQVPVGSPVMAAAAEPAGGPAAYALDEEKPTIYVDYLGAASANSDRSPAASAQRLPAFTAKDVGTVFWVGVRVDNLSKVTFLSEDGLRDLEIAFDYNPEYVVPCDDLSLQQYDGHTIDLDQWRANIVQFNFSTAADNSAWNSAAYELSEGSAFEAEPDVAEGREYEAPSTWRTQFISIMKTDEQASTNRFYGIADDGDYYLLKLPFQLKQIPADGAKPLAFRLALGPSSLVMTTGDAGMTAYAWEAETRTLDELNLKKTFQFGGDLNIFKSADYDELTTLTVKHTAEESTPETPVYTTVQLYSDAEQTQQTNFSPAAYDYYVTAPAGVTELMLDLSSLSAAPKITQDSYNATTPNPQEITPTEDTALAGNWSATVPLSGTGTEAYKDTITVVINEGKTGEATYHIYVKRESAAPDPGEASIELAPGNSPYGLIERMGEKYYAGDGTAWTEEQIAEAKEQFAAGNRFVTGYVPDGGNTAVIYTANAWAYEPDSATEVATGEDLEQYIADHPEAIRPYINYDKDPNAVFAYIKTSFVDPGFVLQDSSGNVVVPTEALPVTRTITYDTMPSDDLNGYAGASGIEPDVKLLTGADGENVIDFTAIRVKPGIYTISYAYTDAAGKECIAERTLVVVPQIGDVNLNNIPNATDANVIKQRRYVAGHEEGSDQDARVMEFRVADIDKNGIVNATDANILNQRRSVPFYTDIMELDTKS